MLSLAGTAITIASRPERLQALIPHLTDALLRGQSAHQTAEANEKPRDTLAESVRHHHHGCCVFVDYYSAIKCGVCIIIAGSVLADRAPFLRDADIRQNMNNYTIYWQRGTRELRAQACHRAAIPAPRNRLQAEY